MEKSAMITICGRPNVGKSTLTNALVGGEDCDSLRQAADDAQPNHRDSRARRDPAYADGHAGLSQAAHTFRDYMVNVVSQSVADVDLVLLLVEPVAEIGKQEEGLIARLRETGAPAVLVINKIDTVERPRLLEVMALYSAAYDFGAIIPISAKTGEGIPELLDEMEKYAVEGPHLFPDDMITDQPERQICAELVREKLLKCLDKEIPHGTAVEVTRFTERDNGIIDLEVTIYCEKDSHKGIIIGKKGAMLKRIGELARKDIEEFMGTKVNLQTWVKVKENWRDSTSLLRNFGFKNE